jgi:hypothetical protein
MDTLAKGPSGEAKSYSQDNGPIPIPSCHLPIPVLIRQPNHSSFLIALCPFLIVDRCITEVQLGQSLTECE